MRPLKGKSKQFSAPTTPRSAVPAVSEFMLLTRNNALKPNTGSKQQSEGTKLERQTVQRTCRQLKASTCGTIEYF